MADRDRRCLYSWIHAGGAVRRADRELENFLKAQPSGSPLTVASISCLERNLRRLADRAAQPVCAYSRVLRLR